MASRSVNKVILIGTLGKDPEVRYTGGGTPVCTVRMATNESYKDREDHWIEKTEWHSVVFWGRLAEICGEYIKKGSRIYVEGQLQTRSWDDRDGNTRYVTEVKARQMIMLDSRSDSAGGERVEQPDPEGSRAPSGSNGGPESRQGRSDSQGTQRPAPAQQTGLKPAAAPNSEESSQPLNTFTPDDDLPF